MPVKFTIPVLPSVSATVTFQRCELRTPDESLFVVPDDYEPDAFKYLPERMAESVAKREGAKASKKAAVKTKGGKPASEADR